MATSKLYLKRDSKIRLFKNTYFVEDLQTDGCETPVRWLID